MSEFKEMFSSFNVDNLDEAIKKFEIYYKELIDYNQKVNLTAITEKQEVYIKHFYDSGLAINNVPSNASVVDVGTGAGFPGVPIKILRPDINLSLVDSLNKRIVFLDYLKDKLSVEYNTYHSRAEEFCSNIKYREQFDICVSRAVAKLNTLAEYCLPLVKVGGKFIAYKSGDVEQEITESTNAIKLLGGEIMEIKKVDLPNNMGSRSLVLIKKIKNTNKKYPRNKNLPKLKPL